jgi:HK97 family phage prohead protease/HK97 family phage major capsid protein
MVMKTKQDIEPDDDESYEDFMDRCSDEIGDDDACQLIWDNRGAETVDVVHKTHAAEVSGMEFVMSDETADRMDDIIMADGWDLENFKRNPIALFGHRSDFPIGKWKNLRIENKQLRGHLELAPDGTSRRIDEIRRLIDAGILKAVSVGFRPKEYEPLDKENPFSGYRFTKQELVETSLVSVPANPNALAVAKYLKISPATIDVVFAEQGNKDGLRRRRFSGKKAVMQHVRKGVATMSLSQRIADTEKRKVDKIDELKAYLESFDNDNVSDEQMENTKKLNDDIAQIERTLTLLRDSERNLATTALDTTSGRAIVPAAKGKTAAAAAVTASPRPFGMPKKQLSTTDLLVRSGVVQLFSHLHHKDTSDVRKAIYGDDEQTRAVVEWATRAATAPAMTTVVGWAAELVQQIVTDFMETLLPKSVFPRLSAAGLGLTFGRNGKIIIPTRSRTPSIAGSFVGEGQPIPVRQGAFTSQTLTPKKMAVITTWTREIDEHSVPAIEGLLRAAIGEDTAISLDAILLDANAATLVRPAGILNGVAGLTPTAGGGFNAVVGDIKQLTGALITGTLGNVRNPVWLMNPQQVNSLGLVAMPGLGAFPFRAEVAAGNLGGWPIIDAGTVPLGTVIAMDAADYVSVTGDGPRFEISDQATLHFDDTTPADIGTVGTPGVVAAPAKSMFQTDSLALRLILPINWTIRRPGTVAWVAGVTW